MSQSLNRIERLQQSLINQSIDAMIILKTDNIRYLTMFTGSAGVLVVTPDTSTLYVTALYAEQAAKLTIDSTIEVVLQPLLIHVLDNIKANHGKVSFEANHLVISDFDLIQKKIPDATLIGLRNVIEDMRAIKEDDEIIAIRRAIKIADDVFDAFCGWVEPGLVENNVAARLEYEQRLLGGEKNASGVTIVASGSRTSLPHGVATDKIIGENEPVMIDIGTVVSGYCSDLTRTVHLGKASSDFKKLYRIVFDAQQNALEGIRAGMTAKQADSLAREIIVASGYGDGFSHSLGHSIGLDVHENPRLNPLDSTILNENMVFTVEPGIYIKGLGGVRIEDIIRVTEDGCEVLSTCTRNLVEL